MAEIGSEKDLRQKTNSGKIIDEAKAKWEGERVRRRRGNGEHRDYEDPPEFNQAHDEYEFE